MAKSMIFYSIMWAGAIIIFGYLDWLWLIVLVPMALGDLIRRKKHG
jgi:type IV secretory pathway VirB2 component (pilin)